MENENNETNPIYESWVFELKIKLGDDYVCGKTDYLNIALFDSCFGEEDTDIYIPIVGVVKGTKKLCYGVRCCEDNMFFRIYDRDNQSIHSVYIVDNIATIVETYPANDIYNRSLFRHYQITERSESEREVNVDKMHNVIKEYQQVNNLTAVDKQFALDYYEKDQRFVEYSENLTSVAEAVYFSVISNFMAKFHVREISQLTKDKKIIKLFEKCKNRYGQIKIKQFNDLLSKIDVADWFDMFEEVKRQLPDYEVFEGTESPFDVLGYSFGGESEYVKRYF